MTCEIDRVGPNATPDFEDAFPAPTLELGEAGNVWLDEVLSPLDLIKVLARTDGFWRVANVARTAVPVVLDRANTYVARGNRQLTVRNEIRILGRALRRVTLEAPAVLPLRTADVCLDSVTDLP